MFSLSGSASNAYRRQPSKEISVSFTGQPRTRYYVVHRGRENGVCRFGLVEAIRDPARPHEPERDRRDGPSLFEGVGTAFWTAINRAGFAWVRRDFKRYWVWEPDLAARNIAGID